MKVFARKDRGRLSVVSNQKSDKSALDVNANALENSFHGWLNSVARTTQDILPGALPVYRVPRLTARDVMRVNQATIREGESHCIWPPTVVQQFSSADVIRKSSTQHYVLQDANLTRVEYKQRRRSS